MHEVQKRLLSLASISDLGGMSYRQIAKRVDCRYASQVQHHIGQLHKHGYLAYQSDGSIVSTGKDSGMYSNNMLSIPVLGEADCGEATKYATDIIQNYLTISYSSIRVRDTKKVYALIAKGNSMNSCKIQEKAIQDSDYVIVEKNDSYTPNNGDCIVSIIDGMANIKRFYRDEINQRIVLYPDSLESSYLPVIIDNDDLPSYHIAGKVVDVVKGISHLFSISH